MYFENKTILIISPEPWSHLHVSKHHYAIELAKRGNQVFFLNPPSPFPVVRETEYQKISVIEYNGFVPGLNRFPRLFRRYFTKKVFNKVERLARKSFDVLWSFDNSVFYEMKAIPDKVLKISHIVDENMDFQFKNAAKSANICLGSTTNIVNRLKENNPNSYFINHGYSETKPEEYSLPDSEGIKVGYAGNLEISYLDWELIEQIVNENPELEFFFAGGGSGKIKASNVHYLGSLSKSHLRSFYEKMDVLIIVYKADEFPNQLANPHKMMEYLASGKPIIATLTKEYQKYSSIAMTRKNQEYPELFKNIVADLSSWNHSQLCEERTNIAMNNTYGRQLQIINEILSSL